MIDPLCVAKEKDQSNHLLYWSVFILRRVMYIIEKCTVDVHTFQTQLPAKKA